MKYGVIILPVAKADINAAAKWIRQNDSPELAKMWVNEINDAVASLDTFPARCALAGLDDVFEEEIRQLLYGKGRGVYRILFTIQNETVVVLRVLHSARDINAEL
ncbi:type II toxin-antitoxin system RelE/ParE family toxin [Nostoc sp. KVJ3]|uniref:type II toxin-antitoxin system RelE/ParE family toxin n=1 Tax=Nostoc sp. KVJ3 TaxID=457945 RepID=UPI00223713FB|nr:type II toxin-antitoxin system RelE/ParE family toxin [Nostoc sp. KVJ3]MCW5317749.1 type II toxin-antitoxin system RelE/ParE family toxin [Nostoc sp. KVJ3]